MSSGRLLLECTYVFGQPWVHSGIPRVVRNIVANAAVAINFDGVFPVAIGRDRTVEVGSLLPRFSLPSAWAAKALAWLRRGQAAAERLLAANGSGGRFAGLVAGRAALRTALAGVGVCCRLLQLAGADPYLSRGVPFQPRKGDTLLLLDASWHDPAFFARVAELKRRGVRVVAVVYDLIPLRHAGFCDESLPPVFRLWFESMMETADAFVCISKWVCGEVQDEILLRGGEKKMREKGYGWFHLGTELDLKKGTAPADRRLGACFAGDAATFLVVGTIEPRKNHAVVLEAFERHWAGGGNSRLCIIGRVGWKCRDIQARLRSHPQKGRRLFWLEDADDDELEFAYRKSRALVFASFVEGFGLPLVEGLQRGLPAIASDIPVFREVAGEFAEYFNPESAADLCKIIDGFSISGKLPNARPPAEWKRITWRESAGRLFSAVSDCLVEIDSKRSGQ